jgi:GNAT superfamily N-acetyltransferase
MSIQIKEVNDRKALKDFVNFPYQLYKGNPFFVPPLRFDELATIQKEKNPAFDYCDAKYWIARNGEKIVGRIAGIINYASIEKWGNKFVRFGWIDFAEDKTIAEALLGKVEDWARELKMEAVHGPLGFTDLDHEGMLIDGFDNVGTLATIYNYPYYPKFLEELGYKKDVDWVEYLIKIPNRVPDNLKRISSLVKKRCQLQVVQKRSSKEILPYASEIFQLINTAYSGLYGVVPLTEKQISYYTKQYFSFIKPDFVSLITDRDGKLAAFGITMPSLSKALQKANGKLFPFGIFHLLKAMKSNTILDLYIVAIRPDLQGKGVNAILMDELTSSCIKHGITFSETNPELEENEKVQALWEHYETRQHKRRRCYIKYL